MNSSRRCPTGRACAASPGCFGEFGANGCTDIAARVSRPALRSRSARGSGLVMHPSVCTVQILCVKRRILQGSKLGSQGSQCYLPLADERRTVSLVSSGAALLDGG